MLCIIRIMVHRVKNGRIQFLVRLAIERIIGRSAECPCLYSGRGYVEARIDMGVDNQLTSMVTELASWSNQ